jgi:hypothetical protein
VMMGSWSSAMRGLMAREMQKWDYISQCPSAVEEHEEMMPVWAASRAAP